MSRSVKDGHDDATSTMLSEYVQDFSSEKNSIVKGFFSSGKIFDLNKVQVAKDREALVLEGLLKQSEDTFGHQREIQEVPGLPELTKYFYVLDEGTQIDDIHVEGNSWENRNTVDSKSKMLGCLDVSSDCFIFDQCNYQCV